MTVGTLLKLHTNLYTHFITKVFLSPKTTEIWCVKLRHTRTVSDVAYQRTLDVVDLRVFTQQGHIRLHVVYTPILVLLDVLPHLFKVHRLPDHLVIVGQRTLCRQLVERFA